MDTWVWLVLIAAAFVVGALAAWALLQRRRTAALRGRFGPEYERTVQRVGDQRGAEAELEARAARVERLHIQPLPADRRLSFANSWKIVQTRFVEDPNIAVRDADRLVAEAMEARGYPVGDFDQRAADVSVDHPEVVEHYRAAHALALRQERGAASTEDLRQAMVHYRALFEDLLGSADSRGSRAA